MKAVILLGLGWWVLPLSAAGEKGVDPMTAAVREKLEKIVIPKIAFREAAVNEVIDFLKQKSMQLDPAPDPALRGVGITSNVREPRKRITLVLWNIPLWEALRYVAMSTGSTLQVTARGISIEPKEAGDVADDVIPAAAISLTGSDVILPVVEFRNVTVMEACDFLRAPSSDAAPRGVNIVWLPESKAAKSAPPKVTLSLRNVGVDEVLRAIAAQANLELIVEQSAVVARPRKR